MSYLRLALCHPVFVVIQHEGRLRETVHLLCCCTLAHRPQGVGEEGADSLGTVLIIFSELLDCSLNAHDLIVVGPLLAERGELRRVCEDHLLQRVTETMETAQSL